MSATFSLHSNSLEKSLHEFDTVIIDDASMVSEADTITSLRHGCQRAILMGNPQVHQANFLINPTNAQRTLYSRIRTFIDLEPFSKKSINSNIKFTFIDLEDSKEEPKKESFTNLVEAEAIADLLSTFDIDLTKCAVMTPYRTQSLVIKNCL